MAIVEDASTPAPKQQTGTTTTTTTASFTPPASSLVVVLGCAGFALGTGHTTTYAVSDSGANTWTQLAYEQATHSSGSNAGGTVGVWCCYFATSPGAMTVTGTAGTNFGGGQALCVKVLTGASSTQTGATTIAEFGNPTNATTGSKALTTTTVGSIVYGLCDDGNNGGTWTANGSTTNITTPTPAFPWHDATDVITVAAWKSSTTVTPGSVTLGGTWSAATQSVLAMAEILPATTTTVPVPELLNQTMMRAATR